MNQAEILKMSERLCERGLLKCVGIHDGRPVYELTSVAQLALLRTGNN